METQQDDDFGDFGEFNDTNQTQNDDDFGDFSAPVDPELASNQQEIQLITFQETASNEIEEARLFKVTCHHNKTD
jgi:hypothetical protein